MNENWTIRTEHVQYIYNARGRCGGFMQNIYIHTKYW